MVGIISDIHIRLNASPSFERHRVQLLSDIIKSHKYSHIIINGDLLNSPRPTLDEVELAQAFVDSLSESSTVYLLDGNHESVNIREHTSTYDKIRMHNCTYIKDDVVGIEGITYRLVSWSHLNSLGMKKEADILVTHVRSDLGERIKAERCMKFLEDYPLNILGDIHMKHSPVPNAHYTSSPYAVKFTSGSPSGSYIEVDGMSWRYVDLDLPQKVKLSGQVSDFREFTPNPEHLYKVFVEGSIEDLRTLKYFHNVAYVKIVTRVEGHAEELPESLDLLELVVSGVCNTEPYKGQNQKVTNIIQELI